MNRRIRLALVAVLLVVIVLLAWFLVLSPVRGDIASTNASIDDARAKLSAAQAKLAQAEITRQEGRKNQGRLLELAKLVPDSEEIPSLLLQIQDLATQSGIALVSVTPNEPQDEGAFSIVPLALEFTGTFFDLSDFVYRVEQFAAAPGRLLAIKDLTLELNQQTVAETAGGAAVGPELRVSLTLYAFEMASSQTTATTAGKAAQSTTANTSVSGNESTTTTTG